MTHAQPRSTVRWTAWAGVAALLPYAAIKTYWACGGTAGLPPGWDMATEFRRNGAPEVLVWMEQHGVDFTVVLAAAGVALLMALVQPWGTRPPRSTLLVPAWLGAAILLPWGLLTALAALTGVGAGEGPRLSPWITVVAVVAFCGVGFALARCAWSYQRRSRPARTAGTSG